MKRSYYVFSNGRLARHQNTVYLHQFDEERTDADESSLAEAATQSGCVLEDWADDYDLDLENSILNETSPALSDIVSHHTQ